MTDEMEKMEHNDITEAFGIALSDVINQYGPLIGDSGIISGVIGQVIGSVYHTVHKNNLAPVEFTQDVMMKIIVMNMNQHIQGMVELEKRNIQ